MRDRKFAVCILFASTLLSGCGIGGFWMNGDPFAGNDIKPYIEKWDKPGMTSGTRDQDSANCGGGSGSHAPGFSQGTVKAAQRPGEKDNVTYSRLHHEWQRCMLKKGYRYTGECYSQSSPACGAP